MSNTAKLENNLDQVKKLIRDIDHRLSLVPDDVSLLMSRESMVNHLDELEEQLIEADAESELVTA
jgi:archaellum component FlaC